jgi:hypothetical protein
VPNYNGMKSGEAAVGKTVTKLKNIIKFNNLTMSGK